MPATALTRRSCLAQSAALCLGTWAAGPAQARSARRSVVINTALEPDSLDPTMAAAAAVGEVTHYMLEGLTRIEENGAVAPLLAESWSVDGTGRHYHLRLRQGVRFHDGAAFDAAAVRFSFERAVAPSATNKARKALFDNIASIGTPDAHSVALTLHHPDPQLLFRLGEGPAVMLHPATAAQAATRPVGTGPYQVAQWRRGHGIELAQAPMYRQAARLRMHQASFRFLHDPLGALGGDERGCDDESQHPDAGDRLVAERGDGRDRVLVRGRASEGRQKWRLSVRRAIFDAASWRRYARTRATKVGCIAHRGARATRC